MHLILKTIIAAASLICAVGCAAALNYDDPAGPLVVVREASSRVATNEIRLVTFNVKFGERVDQAADLLSRPGPLKDADVLFLQEMDGPGTEKLARGGKTYPTPRRKCRGDFQFRTGPGTTALSRTPGTARFGARPVYSGRT